MRNLQHAIVNYSITRVQQYLQNGLFRNLDIGNCNAVMLAWRYKYKINEKGNKKYNNL